MLFFKKVIPILLLSLPLWSFAQTAREYRVYFTEYAHAGEPEYLSDTFTLEPFTPISFVGISAYCTGSSAGADISYRIKAEGQWTAWIPFKKNTEGYTEDRVAYTAPFIEQSFSKIQFRSDQPVEKEYVIRLYFPSTEKKSLEFVPADSTCNCIQPTYCDRSCWCPSGNCPEDPTPDFTLPTHIIIHHSAGSNNSVDWSAVVAYIWDLHVNTNGWDDIGYNWLIDPDGVIYEGRGDSIAGAHFSCMNSETSGICLLGNFETIPPTIQAVSNLGYLIAWEACDKQIAPAASSIHQSSQLMLPHISGHRDGNFATTGCPVGTVCPGEDLYDMLPSIRTDVAQNPCLGELTRETVSLKTRSITLYPNPAGKKLHINVEDDGSMPYTIEICDPAGQNVLIRKMEGSGKHEYQLNIEHLPAGYYMVRLISDNVVVKRFVKK